MNSWKKAKAAFLKRAEETDFDAMDGVSYGRWVDGLPMEEFFAMMSLHDEWRRTGEPVGVSAVREPPPDTRPWIDLPPDVGMPVPGETLIFVRLADGDENTEPMRADSLIWGEPDSGAIVKYYVASDDTNKGR